TVARTLVDLAAVWRADRLEEAIDCAERRELTSLARLWWRAGALGRRGRRGTVLFREILSRRGEEPVPESVLERRFLRLLERNGLPKPLCQHEIRTDDGRFVARVDFIYPDVRAI